MAKLGLLLTWWRLVRTRLKQVRRLLLLLLLLLWLQGSLHRHGTW